MENGDWGRFCNTSKIIYSYLYKWRCRHNKMARVNISILGVSELKWTGMGKINPDDHYIYCGQESLRRNGVPLIVNKRVWNALLGCSLKNNRKISVHFQGKTFNITVIPAYAPTSSAEVAEVERFYEDIQMANKQMKNAHHCLLFSSVQSSHSVVSWLLRLHELQHARPPCPLPTPGVHSNSCPSCQWCHPAISSSVIPFSSCPQSLPASDSFPMSQLFAQGG